MSWRACGPPAVLPAVLPRGEPMDFWPTGSAARGCPPSCPPAWRTCGLLAQEVGGPRLSSQLSSRVASLWIASPGGRLPASCPPSCPRSCPPAWRAYGLLAHEVGGASCALGCPLSGELKVFFPQQLASRRVLEGLYRVCGCFCGPPTSEVRCV